MRRNSGYAPEVRERAVRLVLENRGDHRSEWATICSVADGLGCTPESVRRWLRQAEADQGLGSGLSLDERAELRELRRANEILRKASAYFAQAELDRRFRR